MLILKPNCECCNASLPANSSKAYICTYECTFCEDCLTGILQGICPNCGGDLQKRPIRPEKAYRPGLGLQYHSASTQRIIGQLSDQEITTFVDKMKHIPAHQR
ncbi:DUF1272 domain-containing protein [Alteromonas sp. CI.11.F.A3]|uniref:DUF1272 domain-containing protein n=1 Tax=Alteromonas sp. CI.11.F.A3 TaxID=3079555 RepID=UPI00294398E1|nr:DUF1272 domain-containing protein [Alteromonas sp. CI.11.F.A3]WOI38551.1 DUF1272 domain-containing protein [Alteromonas sp. CI.11.F.A3]